MIAELIVSFIFGTGIGWIYFTGLWETVRRIPDDPKPFRRIALSYILRMGVALTGFYLVMDGQWERLAAAMLGFVAMREMMLRRLGRTSVRFVDGESYGNRGH
jgi:F1F0 ATPase subunit 2